MAAGLDSLVPGEGEILGQVKTAFEAGATGPLLDRVFRQALHAGRRARVETAIGESPASVPAAAAALAQQVFDDLHDRNVVLVGAGKMSELTAQKPALAWSPHRGGGKSDGSPRRGARRPVDRAGRRSRRHRRAAPGRGHRGQLDERAGVHPGRRRLERELRARRGRPLLFVDLAVPRDIDPDLAGFDGCFVYDIDDLEAVVEASLAGRRAEAARAERVVAVEAGALPGMAGLARRRAGDRVAARSREEIRTAELAKAEGRLGRLSESERRSSSR